MKYRVLAAAAAAESLQSCPTLRPHRWQPTRLPRPWDSYIPPSVVHTQRLPVTNMSSESGTSLTFNEPPLTYHYYSKSIADFRVHSRWCIAYGYTCHWASLVAQLIKNLPAMQETWVRSLGWEDPLEKERLPTPVFWPEESRGLYSPWGRRVGHD